MLEAARLEGVTRIILASSGHVTGFYPRAVSIDESAPVRPDSLYGVSKTCAEALGRYYADKFGLQVMCLRIGHVSEEPEYEIDRSIWISPRDLAQLIEISLDHAGLTFATLYAISENAARFWEIERARALGYRPKDGIESDTTIRRKGDAEPVATALQGESFAARGFSSSLEALDGLSP